MSIPGHRISETALRERQLAHARVQTFPNLRYQGRYRNLGCLDEISRFLIRLKKNYTERKKTTTRDEPSREIIDDCGTRARILS